MVGMNYSAFHVEHLTLRWPEMAAKTVFKRNGEGAVSHSICSGGRPTGVNAAIIVPTDLSFLFERSLETRVEHFLAAFGFVMSTQQRAKPSELVTGFDVEDVAAEKVYNSYWRNRHI